MRVWACGVMSLASFLAPAVLARGADDAAKEAVVQALLDRAEAANGRVFDDTFRNLARRRLVELETEELAERLERVATAGLGGLAVPGDATRDLVYTPVAPCRIVDTRVAGGSLAAGAPRDFYVAGVGHQGQGGSINGCGVPKGPATAAVVNFVAVNPVGPGNLRAWAYSTPPVAPPLASVLNYTAGVNIANGIVVPLCDVSATMCTFDLRVQADGSNTHLVVDVVGYFHRLATETVRSFTISTQMDNNSLIGSSCSGHGQVVIQAPVNGRIVVQAAAGFTLWHVQANFDAVRATVASSTTECDPPAYQAGIGPEFQSGHFDFTASFFREFSVAAGTHAFSLNAYKVGSSPVVTDRFFNRRMLATFYPE